MRGDIVEAPVRPASYDQRRCGWEGAADLVGESRLGDYLVTRVTAIPAFREPGEWTS